MRERARAKGTGHGITAVFVFRGNDSRLDRLTSSGAPSRRHSTRMQRHIIGEAQPTRVDFRGAGFPNPLVTPTSRLTDFVRVPLAGRRSPTGGGSPGNET